MLRSQRPACRCSRPLAFEEGAEQQRVKRAVWRVDSNDSALLLFREQGDLSLRQVADGVFETLPFISGFGSATEYEICTRHDALIFFEGYPNAFQKGNDLWIRVIERQEPPIFIPRWKPE